MQFIAKVVVLTATVWGGTRALADRPDSMVDLRQLDDVPPDRPRLLGQSRLSRECPQSQGRAQPRGRVGRSDGGQNGKG